MKQDIQQLINTAALQITQYQKTMQRNYNTISKKPKEVINWIGRQATNLTGKRINKLTVIGYIGKINNTETWQAECVCGNYQMLNRSEITNNTKTECDICKFNRNLIPEIIYKMLDIQRNRAFVDVAKDKLSYELFTEILNESNKIIDNIEELL